MQKQTTYENRKTNCCHGPEHFTGFSENEVSNTFLLQKCFLENMQVQALEVHQIYIRQKEQ